jgi:integrase
LASIHRHPNSRYWYCCINIPGRGQLQRTTKQTDRRKAYDFAQKLEHAARANTLTEIQARKILAEIYEIRNPGERLPGSTIKGYFESWADNKARETSESTGIRYKHTAKRFVKWLGDKSNQDITALSPRDILAFRNELASKLSTSTANHAIKVVRMALKDAQAASLVTANVAIGIRKAKSPEDEGGRGKRPFTIPEIRRLLRAANDEWRGLILFGLYTGQRLGDLATLTWQNVDLARRELGLVTRKTRRRVLIPLAAPLEKFILGLPASDNPAQPVFQKAAALAKRSGTLSNQFYEIMTDAGLARPRNHTSIGKGRSNRRTFNELSFHSLRHTATSLMKDAGISPAIVQDIIGHESPAISAHYTHIGETAKRQAIAAMPDVTVRAKGRARSSG